MSRSYPSSEGAVLSDGHSPRVLVVDDSAPLRAAIAEVLEESGCTVIGRAMDGAMALRLVMDEDPDVITLDLEMPRMDGFTFLRILSRTRNTPVIVITSDARPESALMALELGARDFLVKPMRPSDLKAMRSQLLARVRTLAALRERLPPTWSPPTEVKIPTNVSLVVIGASTGGPKALRDLLARLRPPLRAPIVIAQHMPARFTEAFADRLAKSSGLDVREARHGEPLRPGDIRIAPGGSNVTVMAETTGIVCRLVAPSATDRWVPSVDELFKSAAIATGARTLPLVLTGMGKDGAEGAKALRASGAPFWAESALTAAVDGMPQAGAAAHGNAERIPLDELAILLARTIGSGEPER